MDNKSKLSDFNKKLKFGRQKSSDLIDIYHAFMVTYGYIPFEEFKNMDAYLKDELLIRLNKMYEKK